MATKTVAQCVEYYYTYKKHVKIGRGWTLLCRKAEPAEVKTSEAKPTEVGTGEAKAADGGNGEADGGNGEAKAAEVGAGEVEPAEVGTVEAEPAEVRTGEENADQKVGGAFTESRRAKPRRLRR